MEKEIIREECQYLEATIELVNKKLKSIFEFQSKNELMFNERNQEYIDFLKDQANRLNDSSIVELYNLQSNLDDIQSYGINIEKEKNLYLKMTNKPYFARIDIKDKETNSNEKYYIGIHSLEENSNNFKVLDWRSPISSIFYDYEKGDCLIKTNSSSLKCELLNKRQFGITNGKLDYYIDTTINIEDEVLQQALSKNSSNEMHSIVQTIQKEQNEIIRGSESKTLIVQGVAGSGKTAIALHRIAYLLYKLKNKITSKDIMFISPNNAFSSYISSVLPDLAEDDIEKIQLDLLARNYLKKHCILERKYEQIERLINNNDFEDYEYKTSFRFLKDLKDFAYKNYVENFYIDSFEIHKTFIDNAKIIELFRNKYADKDIFTRLRWITENIFDMYFYKVKSPNKIIMLKESIFTKLYKSIKNKNCVKAYMNFLESKNMKLELVGDKVKNEDGYGILFFKMFILGLDKFENIKHLVIDEMQDYSPVQMYILNYLFECPKTILGDYNQVLKNIDFSYVSSYMPQIFNGDIEILKLNKSYRSTSNIIEFYNKISGKTSEMVTRCGDDVDVITTNKNDSYNVLIKQVENFKNKGFNSIAIITKTNSDAQELFDKLSKKLDNLELIDDNIDLYHNKLCVISAYNSKGLEFDGVIVYDVSDNFSSELDKNLLYIALTRPLHKLSIISIDMKSKFLENI